jgi:U1 small nuclear ribonucleoprotein A
LQPHIISITFHDEKSRPEKRHIPRESALSKRLILVFLVSSNMTSVEEPIQTLYVNNLNDKLPKEQLKEELYLLFSQFGSILDVVALKTERMKGQAWISFVTVQNATDALNTLQGFEFFGKPMVGNGVGIDG